MRVKALPLLLGLGVAALGFGTIGPVDDPPSRPSVALERAERGGFRRPAIVAPIESPVAPLRAAPDDAGTLSSARPPRAMTLPAAPKPAVAQPDPQAIRFVGRVVHADGGPVAGAWVSLLRSRTETDHTGAFALVLPPAQAAQLPVEIDGIPRLVIAAPGFARLIHECRTRHGNTFEAGQIRVIVAAGTVTARVLDVAGQPLEGARLALVRWIPSDRTGAGAGWPGSFMQQARGITDETGRVTLEGLWPGSGYVSVDSGQHRPLRVGPVDVAPGQMTDLGAVILERGETLQGWVVDGDGLPLPGAQLHVEWVGADEKSVRAAPGGPVRAQLERLRRWERRRWRRKPVTTDAAGRFVAPGLAPGAHAVTVEARRCEPSRRLARVPAVGELRIVLQRLPDEG